jgi:vanillate O-demethylase ferredoxin subunit
MVTDLTWEAEGIVGLTLADPSGRTLPRWTPGSHIDLQCGDVIRHYSLCGSPDDSDQYHIAVLLERDSRGGSRFVHEKIAVGDVLMVRGPRNHFRLDDGAEHYLLIAAGIGITPVIAMADALKARSASYELHYAGRSTAAMAFLARLQRDHSANLTIYPKDRIALSLDDLLPAHRPGTRVYACGPQRLLDDLTRVTDGWPLDAVRVEHFSGSLAKLDPTVERAFDVTLVRGQRTVHVGADTTVLSALRAVGVRVESTCEEGLCGSCETTVLAGRLDHRDRVLSAAERAAGQKMMICCSRAASGDLVLDL